MKHPLEIAVDLENIADGIKVVLDSNAQLWGPLEVERLCASYTRLQLVAMTLRKRPLFKPSADG